MFFPQRRRLFFRSGISPGVTWELWFRLNGFLLAVLAVVGVFSVVVVLLLCCHLYLVSINCTTWEFMSRHRISYLKNCGNEENPFDRGVFCNLWDFFCICRTVAWEQMYHRNALNSVWPDVASTSTSERRQYFQGRKIIAQHQQQRFEFCCFKFDLPTFKCCWLVGQTYSAKMKKMTFIYTDYWRGPKMTPVQSSKNCSPGTYAKIC